ncbi:TetR/AcrR family transcriptional regulator [Agromyces sp. MMS24-JH15]|uniref:TetR/AcrR family transcriptional regulator n=1 Tax=Agromyces sp. MMS24-JH15 TaxID=3243765 RepID=UPI003749DD18
MVSTGRRGSYAVGRDRRERILDAASARFTHEGYSQTSMAEIAREVGITGPGLAHHFPTKQHLLLALAERRFDLANERAHAAAPEAADGTATLRRALAVAELFAAQPDLMQLFVLVTAEAADPQSAAHALYAARYERVIDDLAAQFADEVEAGLLRDDLDYREIARECIAVADGLQLQWVLSGGAIDTVALARAHFERLAPHLLRSGASVDLSAPALPAA